MARYRLSEPAKADVATILRTSEERHGPLARLRYRSLLAAAMRRVAADPEGLSTTDRAAILDGVRSFHIRHGRHHSQEPPVAAPVHVIFYRVTGPALIEIIRVLHERMEPSRHLGGAARSSPTSRK